MIINGFNFAGITEVANDAQFDWQKVERFLLEK